MERGRLLPLLLFVVVVAVVAVVLAGVAFAAPTTTTLAVEATASQPAPPTETYTLTAADLGGFGGEAPFITTPSAIVETMDTGKVLYAKKATTRRPMASTTKIMTCILILESGVDLDSTVKVSAKAAGTWEVAKWVSAGSKLTVRELLYALMLRSMNGAAVALAENDAGSVNAFAEKMNAKAAELGMNDTHFVTPNGLDAEGHYSTASDMALLARYAMKNETFRKLVNTQTYTLKIAGWPALEMTNTNKLLAEYSWVNGIKTGSTPNGDYCLVSSGARNGREVVAVVLGNKDTDARFADSAALLKFGLDQYRPVTLVDKGTVLAEATVPYHQDGKLELVTDGSFSTQLAADETLTTQVVIDRQLQLPVKAGDVYGHVVIKSGTTEVGKVDLVATKSFDKVTLGSKLLYFINNLFS